LKSEGGRHINTELCGAGGRPQQFIRTVIVGLEGSIQLFLGFRDHNRLVVGMSCLGLLVAGLCSGCHDRPARVPAPGWDPQEISTRAIELLDKNGDSVIDGKEAKEAPGLAAAVTRIDTDGNGRMSVEEIKRRIEFYEKVGTGLISQTFQITLNGRPLVNARVEFVPEEFLGGVIKPASDYTDRSGVVVPQTVDQSIPAMQVGFYQVVAYLPPDEKPLETSTLVGVEVSPVSTRDESGTPVLRFKSD
jgi:hypothetical protein